MSPARVRMFAVVVLAAVFVAGMLVASSTDVGVDDPVASDGGTAADPPRSTTSTTSTSTTTTTTLPPPRTATLAFTGDLLPHSPVTSAAAANAETGWDFRPMFDEVRPVLSAADLAICHLESPVSVDDTNLSGYPVFNAPRALVEAAVDAGYDGCSTASNHSFDRRSDGVRSTLQVFEELGFPQAGMAADETADLAPVLYEVNDITIAHISATYSLNGFVMPADEQYLVDLIEPAEIVAEAALAKEAGAEFVVVSLHWGNEYQHTPSSAQEQWLTEILPTDEVDLVIGHHAHVVQPVDRVGDEWVVYGLGNFLSNQSANCCVTASQDGMIATVTLLENGAGEIEAVGVHITPTWVDRQNGYVIRRADEIDPEGGLVETLTSSAARTYEVVSRRLGDDPALTLG
ncbi:MAG: CapA family protein [Acidimicrobiales bacterium]|nr:CapA family protein [Acidimicrobiales bacterium]